MIDEFLKLPAHIRRRLTKNLQHGLLAPPYSVMAVRSIVGVGHEEVILSFLEEWQRLGVSPTAAAIWLGSLESALGQSSPPDFVWSGPHVEGVHARTTRRVYEEVLGTASLSIWASTYAFFDGPKAFSTLAENMDRTPGLDVTLLLNIERKRGDTSTSDSLVMRFADRLWGEEWPGKARPRVYYDPRSLDENGGGVLHAKAVVADAETVFVTSANLTEAAFDRNIELGLVLRDRALAATLLAHFRTLIDRDLLRRLPTEQ